ncbi:MAG: DUF134 domain-containing protein [Nitrospirota bacterium]|jgi:predicted DNA-binding protein (UPF0251 family)
MPRPRKDRICGCEFAGRAFKPTGKPMPELEKVTLYRDELEALRLCDSMGLTQSEAGTRMGVSRGTVQRILASARKKSATALAKCMAILLEEPPGCAETRRRDRANEKKGRI